MTTAIKPLRRTVPARALARAVTARVGLVAERLEPRRLFAAEPFGAAVSPAVATDPLDRSFGQSGLVQVNSAGLDLATQPDGKIIIAGRRGTREAGDLIAVCIRLKTDGTRDPTFNGDGEVLGKPDVNGTYFATAVDGTTILCAGVSGGDFLIGRYREDGTLDPRFGEDGRTTIDFGTDDDAAIDVVVLPDGKLLLAGTAGGNFALARVNADGTPDGTFGQDGKKLFTLPAGAEGLSQAGVLPDGRLVAVGSDGRNVVMMRLTAEGEADATFSDDGMLPIERLDGSRQLPDVRDLSQALAVQPDGQVLVANRTAAGDLAVVRVDPDGRLDGTFGRAGGVATARFGGLSDADQLRLQPGGQILAVGTALVDDRPQVAVAAFDAAGDPMTGFGEGGTITFDPAVEPMSRALHVGDLVLRAFGGVLPDGRLLVGASDQAPASPSISSLRRLDAPGRSQVGGPAGQVAIGTFGTAEAGGRLTRLTITDAEGSLVALDVRGGTAEASLSPGGAIRLSITDAGRGAAVTIKVVGGDGRATLGDVTVAGTLREVSGKAADLAGTLFATGPIGKLTLGTVTGTIASGSGSIGRVRASALNDARILSGANLGTDGRLGGSGTAADAFAAGRINSVSVASEIVSSVIAAGLDPVDEAFGDANDVVVGGANSIIRSIAAPAGANDATRIVAGRFDRIVLGSRVDPATDPRFRT